MARHYWVTRAAASLEAARRAAGSEARLIHYDLAGRYALKASAARPIDA